MGSNTEKDFSLTEHGNRRAAFIGKTTVQQWEQGQKKPVVLRNALLILLTARDWPRLPNLRNF